MNKYFQYLDPINTQQDEMTAQLRNWSNINSGSENIFGLELMLAAIRNSFSSLTDNIVEVSLPPRKVVDSKGLIIDVPLGKAISFIKRPNAAFKVFLGGHMDTVFSKESSFQIAEQIAKDKMRGPGVTDMKGGLIVMLKALETFEKTPFAKEIGWEVLINPDEEIGSIGSLPLLQKSALRNSLALIFEPTFSDGYMVSERKGSATLTIIARGKSSHAGRDYHIGRNAIYALAQAIHEISFLTKSYQNSIINVGYIQGGGAVNIVPELAIAKINYRSNSSEAMQEIKSSIHAICRQTQEINDVQIEIVEGSMRPPKPFDEKTKHLFERLNECSEMLGQKMQWKESGGVSDGNILAAEGLSTIDTLGVVGGNIHTEEEYIFLPSLVEKARLAALFLMRIANREIR